MKIAQSVLQDKVDQLKVERDLLQRREEFRSDGEDESRLQSALSQTDVLQQEVESLKVVLSLRNQEIGKLRSQNGDLEKQVNEIWI